MRGQPALDRRRQVGSFLLELGPRRHGGQFRSWRVHNGRPWRSDHRWAISTRSSGSPATRRADEISAAYRARAKELHPDARPDDGTAAERFTRLGAAYRVLSDPGGAGALRRRARAPGRHRPSTAPPPRRRVPRHRRRRVTPPKPFRLSLRSARWAAWGGAGLVVLGLVVGGFVFSLQQHDADLAANGVAATATVVQVNGDRRLEFETAGGRVVRATESVKTGEEQPPLGSTVQIHYDRSDPTSIVTDDSHTGRNITLWIVAVKLVIGGAVLSWFGFRRLRRA